MYMKNTVSKEMKLKQQPTHIHVLQPAAPATAVAAKRATRTPHLHQLIVSAAAANNPLSDNLPFMNETTPRNAMTSNKKGFMLDLKGASAAAQNGEDGQEEDAMMMDNGPISADRIRKHHNSGTKQSFGQKTRQDSTAQSHLSQDREASRSPYQKPGVQFNTRGLKSDQGHHTRFAHSQAPPKHNNSCSSQANGGMPLSHSSTTLNNEVQLASGGNSTSHQQMQQTGHATSNSLSKRSTYRAKEYITSFAKTDRKQSFLTDEAASPLVPQQSASYGQQKDAVASDYHQFGLSMENSSSKHLKDKNQRLTNSVDQYTRKGRHSTEVPATALNQHHQVVAMAAEQHALIQPVTQLSSFSEQRPTVKSKTSPIKGGSSNSLYEQHFRLQQLKSQRVRQASSSSATANAQQELKMEDFMQNQITPKRREDSHAFTRPNAKNVQARYQTQVRSNLLSQQQQLPHEQHNSAANFHMQTEEGVDGAQAIENESDITDEADASSPPPLHIESPLKSAAETLMFQMTQKIGALGLQHQATKQIQQQYSLENSSFGVQQDESSDLALLSKHHNLQQHQQLGEQDLIEYEEPRRGRAMRHQSYKNLFSKNSSTGGVCGELPGALVENNSSSTIMEEGNPLHLNHRLKAQLSQSRSQNNFQQYYEEDQANLQQQQCTTDEEIYDQDGGQDSNFVDVDDSSMNAEDQQRLLVQSCSQQMQAAMMNFRRARPTQQTQPLSSYGTWVQEPHIDEELSDAEEDNSSENGALVVQQKHSARNAGDDDYHLNVDDQTDAVDDDDEDDQDQDGNSEDIIMLDNDKRKYHHHMKTASTAKDGGHRRMGSRVLRTENAAVDDDLDLFQEERTPEQTPQRSGKPQHLIPQFSSTQVLKSSEAKASSSKFTKNATGKTGGKHGIHTPVEVAAGMKQQHTQSYLASKASEPNMQTVQKKKSSQASRQQRMKAQGIASMKVQKISSIDFTQPALQPKRNTLYDENSNQDLSATLKTLKNDGSRATPRSQPITNFQLQQEQAKLIRHRQINQSQKMNHTAFGSSLISNKATGSNPAANASSNPNPSSHPAAGQNSNQSYSTFLNEKSSNPKHHHNSQLLGGSVIKDTKQQQPKSLATKPGNQSCNLLNSSVGKPLTSNKASKHQSQNQSRQMPSHAGENLKGGSSSSKKQGGTVAKNAGAGQKEAKNNNSSIFITAKQSASSSAANCKQILAKGHNNVGSGIKPFSTEDAEPSDVKDSGSKSGGISSNSPEKRFSSRQTAQAAAISMSSSMLTGQPQSHHASTTGLSKTAQQKKEKSRSSAQMLPGVGTSNSILQSHLRQLHNHQQSFTNLQSVSNQFKDNVASRHQELKQVSTWNSQSTPVYPSSSTGQGQSKAMNFAKPTVASSNGAASSMSHTTAAQHQQLKSSSTVKESSSTSLIKDGFLSHTAARATGKRGFFGRDNDSASNTAQSSVKASTANLNADKPEPDSKGTKSAQQRSSSKGKKKNAIKQPNALKAKRSSITNTGGHHGAYMSTEASQARIATGGSFKPQDSSQSLLGDVAGIVRPPSSSKHTDSVNQGQIFQGNKRQRTNTQLGLQSHKHNSMRQSTNNLTLQDLMAQQTTTGSVQQSKLGAKQPSNRGTTTEKVVSASHAGSFTAGSVVSNFKSNSLIKSTTAAAASKKQNSNLLGTGASRSSGIQQISERVELMSAKATATGVYKKNGGASVAGGASQKASSKKDELTGTGKLRSQSTLKNQMMSAGAAAQVNNPNSSLLNFTTQPSEQSKKRSNAQHSIIMAAVEGKNGQIQNSSRGVAVSGARSTTDSKRTSIQGAGPKEWGLADFEKAQYGDRCPKGFEKISLLGKGGCAVVWLAREIHSGKKVALKQFPKPKNQQPNSGTLDPTAKIEIEMGKLLFSENSVHNGYSINPAEFPGILKIAKLYTVIEESKDVWLAYQVGGKCLTNHLFDVKGEFYKGERIYGVQHQDFYRALKEDKQVIVDLIRMLAEVLDVLAMFRIVHADIKPDNILIDFDGRRLRDIKLIDFGSAFSYENPSHISATTPEYLAPEVLDYLERRGQNTDSNGTNSTNLCRRQEPWSYDMWSMGAILLEMLTGIPLWMSLKCRAQTQTGKQLFGMGIFGVQGRQNKKILQKQNTSLKNLQQTLKKYDCYQLDKDPVFMDLLLKMLDPNPITRISPIEVLEHPYIKNKHGTALESPN